MAQVKDLHVTVDDPEKHVGGYVSYNVTTKVGVFFFISHCAEYYFYY